MVALKTKPGVERLETRLTPAGTINLIGTLLDVQGDRGDNAVDIRTQPGGMVNVRVDQVFATFQASQITAVNINTGDGDDDVFTNLGVGTSIDLGRGDDRANVLHGVGSSVLGKQGRDRIYAIIGGPNLIDGGAGRDIAYTNVRGVIAPDPADDNPIVFGQTATPGFTLINGVIYYVPQVGDNTILLTESGGLILAMSSVNGIAQPLATFNRADVTDFATILGPGNDRVINQVRGLNLTVYGAGGDDAVFAGPAGRVLIKGGSGNDAIDASQARDSDITGDAGADTLIGQVVRFDLDDPIVVLAGRRPRKILAA